MKTCVLSLAMMAFTAGAALAQSAADAARWPERPIHFIVPFTPGSSSDIVGRLVAQKLAERLGQPLVVENRVGASGELGTEAIAHAAADGYTLGLANASTHTVAPTLMTKKTYDPRKDFAPVSLIGESPYALDVYPGLSAHNVRELIALAKAKPGQLSFGVAGPATLANLAGVLFNKMANVDITSVQYRGTAQSALDVMAGRVDMQFSTIPPMLQMFRDGTVRAIAVTGKKRSPILPDVPTIDEQGLPGYETSLWQGIVAPAATPAPIVARLNAEVGAILRQADTVEALARLGVEAEPDTQEAFAARIDVDLKKWADVIVSAGIHAN
jgi:tripartite-type tricarboxylate transporter receptor subunit TctC